MIKACIFDFDGTVLNTLESIRYFLNKKLAEYGVPTLSSEKVRKFVGEGALNLMKRALRDGGIDTECIEGMSFCHKLCEEFIGEYDSDPYYLTEPYEGICEAIEELRRRGILLAVLSNKPDSTVKQLAAKNFGDAFSIVEGARAGVPLKPNPAAVLDICERLGILPEETAYFGDTATDMKTAKNYGAKLAVGVLWGFRDERELMGGGADVVISHPSEITELF